MLILWNLTLREMLRKKIFLLAAVLAVVYLALFGTAMNYALAPVPLEGKAEMMLLLLAPGVMVGGFLTAFLSILLSAGLVSGDIDDGTIQTLLVKPIPRWKVLMARFAGAATALSLFAAFLYGGMAWLGMAIAGNAPGTPGYGSLVVSIVVYLLFPLFLMAFSLLMGVQLTPMANGVATGGVYFCGVIAGFVEQIGMMIGNSGMYYGGVLISLISPCDIIMRKAQAVFSGSGEASALFAGGGNFAAMTQPSGAMLIWSIALIVLLILGAIRVFARRDI
jgi:ABC-type transport system involved in multi-copper enzyme maturation permease subunit